MDNSLNEVVVQLANLLCQLKDSNNEQRNAAEEQLNNEWMAKQPVLLLTGLSNIARNQIYKKKKINFYLFFIKKNRKKIYIKYFYV